MKTTYLDDDNPIARQSFDEFCGVGRLENVGGYIFSVGSSWWLFKSDKKRIRPYLTMLFEKCRTKLQNRADWKVKILPIDF